MLFEQAIAEDDELIYEQIRQAKKDYDNALNRFNNASDHDMTELAISDMHSAMKRYCFIINTVKRTESSDRSRL